MTVVDALFLVGAFVVAVLYRKLVEREIMYKDYYEWSLKYMEVYGADPVNVFHKLIKRSNQGANEELAKQAVEDAFVHYFRCRGVKIENLKIYWND